MKEEFETLSRLQDIDLRILDIEKSREEFPEQLAALEAELADAGRSLVSLQDKLTRARKSRKDVDDQIADAHAALDKSQDRLAAVKTNKEYDAVHAEMETHKHTLAGGEKRIEKIADDIANLEAKIADIEVASQARIDELTPRIEELRARIATIDTTIAEAAAEREQLAAAVLKPVLRAYENVRRGRKDGRVISTVNSTDRTCTVCYQKLQPQVVNVLRRGAGISYCQNCGSIMVWQE